KVARPDWRRLAPRKRPPPPRPGLEDHVAGGVERTPGAVEELVVHAHRSERRRGGVNSEGGAERGAPHADGVDLVDEDDAGSAPLARGPLRLPGEVADDDR